MIWFLKNICNKSLYLKELKIVLENICKQVSKYFHKFKCNIHISLHNTSKPVHGNKCIHCQKPFKRAGPDSFHPNWLAFTSIRQPDGYYTQINNTKRTIKRYTFFVGPVQKARLPVFFQEPRLELVSAQSFKKEHFDVLSSNFNSFLIIKAEQESINIPLKRVTYSSLVV